MKMLKKRIQLLFSSGVWKQTALRAGAIAVAFAVLISSPNLTTLHVSAVDSAPADFLTYYDLNIQNGVLNGASLKSQYSNLDVPDSLSLTIPANVTSIGDEALWGINCLTSVTIPSSVTSIGDRVFYDCESLTSVTIPSSVTSIGDRAFYDCESLTSVTIPSSVTSIGEHMFNACLSLTSVTIPSSVTSIGEGAFYACGLTSITIPPSVTDVECGAFGDSSNLASITFESATTTIGNKGVGNVSESDTTASTIPANTVIYGYDPSTAKDYATECGRTFKPIENAPVTLESIAVTTPPDKTSYVVGDSLDITGLVVTGTYSDGSTKVEPITAADISGFDSSAPNHSETVTITYDKRMTTYDIQVGLPSKSLVPGTDTSAFTNSFDDFFNTSTPNSDKTYSVTAPIFDRLAEYVELYSGGKSSPVINDLLKNMSSSWGGSCFGMSSAMLLSKSGDINIQNFNISKTTIKQFSDLGKPKDDFRVKDLVNYYQLSMYTTYVWNGVVGTLNPRLIEGNGNEAEAIQVLSDIVAKAQSITLGGKPFMLIVGQVSNGEVGSHAIICNGYEKNENGYYELEIIDPNNPTEFETLKIADDFTSYQFSDNPYNIDASNWYMIAYMNADTLNSVDIDGTDNKSPYFTSNLDTGRNGAKTEALTGTFFDVDAGGGFSIFDASGSTFTRAQNFVQSGNLVPDSEIPLSDGVGGEMRYHFSTAGTYTVTPAGKAMDVSALDNNSFASVDESGASNIVFKSNNALDINGNSFAYTASVPDPALEGNIQVSSNNGANVSISQNTQGVIVSSPNLQNLTVGTVREPDGENTTQTVSTDKTSILIKDKTGDSTGAVQVFGSSKNDGNYDQAIGETAVSPSSTTYNLVYTAGAGGTVAGSAKQTVSQGADGTSVAAIANAGYHFVKWSDGFISATRQDKKVTGDIRVTALFSADSSSSNSSTGTYGGISTSTPESNQMSSSNSQAAIVNPQTGDERMNWYMVILSLILAGTAIGITAFSVLIKKKAKRR